jgi:urease accessory protein UreF
MSFIENSALPDPAAQSKAASLLGDFSALLRQIGNPSALFEIPTFSAADSLREFLETYFSRILVSVEIPAMIEAFTLARQGGARELIVLDEQLGSILRPTPFARASREAGRLQLTRMRPLRDERTVQRYADAVEAGRACGWHPLVYALTLSVYSVPLRQGLNFYAQETLAGFATAAARSQNIPVKEVLESFFEPSRLAVEVALRKSDEVTAQARAV